MYIKIWGARGSVPTPILPEAVREKMISALMRVSEVEDREFREKLISAISEKIRSNQVTFDEAHERRQLERKTIIEKYLENLSPLAGSTASGNTPCVEVRSGKDLFIIDAGSGIRELGLELMKGDCGQGKGTIHILFSHPHWDHIQGFPFFRPAFIPGNKIFLYSVHDIETALRRQQESISFPVSVDYMQADMEFIRLQPGEELKFDEVRIQNMLNHHPGDAYAYRFEKGDKVFVYASDSAYPTGTDIQPYVNFFNRADVLIFDSQFTQRESDEKEDWGHSSSFFGVEMAQEAKIKELVLFHYDPTYSDQDLEKILQDTLKFQYNQYPSRSPVKVSIAQEGQTFDLTPSPTTQIRQVPGGKVAILKPTGIFDENVAAELATQLQEFREQNNLPPQLVVDMSAIELLQVAGLRALVRLRKEQQGTPMVLAGPSINVQQLIELAGYLDFFAIYPSVHTALNALKAHETLNLPGQLIKNRYSVQSKIGDGRLGTVFKAMDTRRNQTVALKVLSASFSEGAIEQFLNQARQIIDLIHSNIVDIYDCDEDRGLSYMVEEYIEGRTLRDLIDDNPNQPLPLDIALSIAESIAHALEYAHGHGVIHGDLKPKNVMLVGQKVKISDFGLGRLESGNKTLINLDVPLAVISARYVAPEQILGHPIDARTDLYALGAILYELFTGQPLFVGSDEEVLTQHRLEEPTSPRELNPNLSHSLQHLIVKLLDKDPNKRYAKASQVRRILASMVTASTNQFPRHRWPSLVGHTDTLNKLDAAWGKTQDGQGQIVFIKGESGMGKTRLTHELTHEIGAATLLMGKCRRFEGSPAYQPFIEALKTYFASTPTEIAQSQAGQVLRQMSRVVPEIREFITETMQHLPFTATDSQIIARKLTTPASQDLTDFAGLAALIGDAAEERPWLLILDDLHWADQSTLQLLQYLSRHCHQMRLMIVCTYQESLVEENAQLVETIKRINKTVTTETVTLTRMSQIDVEHFLHNIWLQKPPNDLVTAVYNRSQGNPFFTEEIAKGLIDDQVVSWRDNKWHFASVLESSLPRDNRDAILRRLNRLSKETQTLLHQAAILGRTLKFADLHAMSDLSTWDALESLDIALERQFIIDVPAEGVIRFKHAEIQEVLYKNLSHLKRQLMHREASDSLEHRILTQESEEGVPVHDVSGTLAYHSHKAGEFRKAMQYSRQAAQHAEAVYASRVALTWYTQSLDALDQLNLNETELDRFDLLLAREQVLHHCGERLLQAYDLATLQQLGQILDDPAKQAIVHNRQAVYERLAHHLDEAFAEANAGLISARQAKSPILEAESLTQLAYISASRGKYQEALEHIKTAQRILGNKEDQWPVARFLFNLMGTIHTGLHQYDKAQEYYEQALNLNRSTGYWPEQATTLNLLSDLYLEQGEYSQAKAASLQALEINRTIAFRHGEATSLYNLALVYHTVGNNDTAEAYLKQALSFYTTLHDRRGEAVSHKVLGALYRTKEEFELAAESLQHTVEIFQQLKLPLEEAATHLEIGRLLEDQEQFDEARQAYDNAYNLGKQHKNDAAMLEAEGGIARCLLAQNKADEAQERMLAGLDWLEHHNLNGINDPIHLYLTIYRILRATNNTDQAKKAWQICQDLIQERAKNINEADLRASFLDTIPEEGELILEDVSE